MALQNDATVLDTATLYRILHEDWITSKGGNRRAASIAFFEAQGEVSYFVDGPNVLEELRRIFPGKEIASIPASVIRQKGFAIERRPTECPTDFHANHGSHVVCGPAQPMERNVYEKLARSIAKHPDVAIVPTQSTAPEAQ